MRVRVGVLLFVVLAVCLSGCRERGPRVGAVATPRRPVVHLGPRDVQWFSVLPDSSVAVVDGEKVSLVGKDGGRRVLYRFRDAESRLKGWRVDLSPDRSRMVLYSRDPLRPAGFVVVYDIGAKKVLYRERLCVSWAGWSSDGRRVAWLYSVPSYRKPDTHRARVKCLDVTAGKPPVMVYAGDRVFRSYPEPPDPRKVFDAMVGWSAGSSVLTGYSSASVLRLDVDSGSLRTVDLAKRLPAATGIHVPVGIFHPDLSSRGELLFLYGNDRIYAVDYRSLSPETVRSVYQTNGDRIASDVRWSPDGGRVACSSLEFVNGGCVGPSEEKPPYSIHVFDRNGKGAVEVLSAPAKVEMLDWLSDDEILYLSEGKLFRLSLADGKTGVFFR